MPVVAAHPPAFVIFFGSLSTIVVCLANLIMAVMVERACEAKTSDFEHMMNMRVRDEGDFKGNMTGLCREITHQKDGVITLAELLVAYDENDDFHTELAKLDIEKDELAAIFKLGDTRSLGEVPFGKLIDDLYKVRSKDMRSLNMLIKYELSEIHRAMAEMAVKLDAQAASFTRSLGAGDSLQAFGRHGSVSATRKVCDPFRPAVIPSNGALERSGAGQTRQTSVITTLSQWEASKAMDDRFVATMPIAVAYPSGYLQEHEGLRGTAAEVVTSGSHDSVDPYGESSHVGAASCISPRFVPDSEHGRFPRPAILTTPPLSCRNSPNPSVRSTIVQSPQLRSLL